MNHTKKKKSYKCNPSDNSHKYKWESGKIDVQ